jgi:hypothetical protein
MFSSTRATGANHNDLSYDVVLRNCNGKLTQWMDTWEREMQRGMVLDTGSVYLVHSSTAGGESFHFSILHFFRLHVRLFLNSFGIQAAISPVRA